MTITKLPMDQAATDAARQQQADIWAIARDNEQRPTYVNSRTSEAEGRRHLAQERKRRGL